MNDLQLSQPAKAQLQPSALDAVLLPEAEPKKPLEPQDDYDNTMSRDWHAPSSETPSPQERAQNLSR